MSGVQLPACPICDDAITRLSLPKKTFSSEKSRAAQVLDGQAMFCSQCGGLICGKCYKTLNVQQQSCPFCRNKWGGQSLQVTDTIGLGHHAPVHLPLPPAPTVPTYPVPGQYTSFIRVQNIVVPRQMPPGHSSWGFHVGGPPQSPSPLALADAWNEWWMTQGHPTLFPDD